MSIDEINERLPKDYEPNVINFRGLWWTAGGLAALIVFGFLLMQGLTQLFGTSRESKERRPTPESLASSAEPTLEPNQAAALAALRTVEQARLNGYAWIDKEAGTARIPIARATEILSQHAAAAEKSADGVNRND
jgi:hypothetical protein